VSQILPFVLIGVVFLVFGIVIAGQLRTDKQMRPIKESVLADPVVRSFTGVRVQLNPEHSDRDSSKEDRS
jgi:sensor domain CHASE-containing protein